MSEYKRKIAFKTAAAVCVTVFIAIMLTSCGIRTFNLENITKIELTDGRTDNIAEITNPDIIQKIKSAV